MNYKYTILSLALISSQLYAEDLTDIQYQHLHLQMQ